MNDRPNIELYAPLDEQPWWEIIRDANFTALDVARRLRIPKATVTALIETPDAIHYVDDLDDVSASSDDVYVLRADAERIWELCTDESARSDLGHWMRRLRTLIGMSQGPLAERIDTSAQYVSAMEAGTRPATTETFVEVWKVFRVEWLGLTNEHPPASLFERIMIDEPDEAEALLRPLEALDV